MDVKGFVCINVCEGRKWMFQAQAVRLSVELRHVRQGIDMGAVYMVGQQWSTITLPTAGTFARLTGLRPTFLPRGRVSEIVASGGRRTCAAV